jgi:hypothetical protein
VLGTGGSEATRERSGYYPWTRKVIRYGVGLYRWFRSHKWENQVYLGVENLVNLGGTIATSCKVVTFNTPCRRDVYRKIGCESEPDW